MEYIKNAYPNGVETLELLQDKNIPKEMLHWGRKNLAHSPEELEAYFSACNVVNSKGVWYSTDIIDSTSIVKSEKISNSRSVFKSSNVKDSSEVVGCKSVKSSKQIFHSSFVERSEKIMASKNITDSVNIINSISVAGSTNIWGGGQCFDSSELFDSQNLEGCFFCSRCADSTNLMFCRDLNGVEYHIFNKPVSKRQFDLFCNQYKELMQTLLCFTEEWPSDFAKNEEPILNAQYNKWFKSVSKEFWQWARTLPNYDPMVLYTITFDKKFLDEI